MNQKGITYDIDVDKHFLSLSALYIYAQIAAKPIDTMVYEWVRRYQKAKEDIRVMPKKKMTRGIKDLLTLRLYWCTRFAYRMLLRLFSSCNSPQWIWRSPLKDDPDWEEFYFEIRR